MSCKIKDTDVFYEILGEGTPIVLLHGWSRDHHALKRTFEPLFELKPGWKRIYLDLPGHGKTPGKQNIQSQDDILELILEFIDKVVGEEKFLIGGLSLGAYLARGVIYHKQPSIDGALLIVPLIIAPDNERDVPPHTVVYQEPGLLSGMTDEEKILLDILVVQSQEVMEMIREGIGLIEPGDEEFRAPIREDPARYSLSVDVDQLAEPFMGPSLFVTGRQDHIVGYRDAWKILENFPRATFAVLDRAGHILGLEQKELLETLISEWLERVEEYIKGKPTI
jgi:pimeloyl-ACP methyl ester carboxylesterase